MPSNYARWLELEGEAKQQMEEEFTYINKFAKKLTKVVNDADNFYDAYEEVEELLKEFVELNK